MKNCSIQFYMELRDELRTRYPGCGEELEDIKSYSLRKRNRCMEELKDNIFDDFIEGMVRKIDDNVERNISNNVIDKVWNAYLDKSLQVEVKKLRDRLYEYDCNPVEEFKERFEGVEGNYMKFPFTDILVQDLKKAIQGMEARVLENRLNIFMNILSSTIHSRLSCYIWEGGDMDVLVQLDQVKDLLNEIDSLIAYNTKMKEVVNILNINPKEFLPILFDPLGYINDNKTV